MEIEDPSITFDRVAGETAMLRQLVSLLLAHSPGALDAFRQVDATQVRDMMESHPASDVFIGQAVSVFEDVKSMVLLAAPGARG